MECFVGWQIDWGKVAEIIATSITTLAAAYFGAKFAFDMQVSRENKKRVAQNIESANLVIFTIRRFRGLFKSLLESAQTQETPFDSHYLILKPFSSMDFERPSFAFDSVAFILNTNKSFMFRLASLQNSLSSTLDLVRRRSELHYSEVQPAIEALQSEYAFENVPNNFPDMLAKKLGPRLDAVMESLTVQMLAGLQEDMQECTALANDMAAAVEKIYPKQAKRRLWADRGTTPHSE